MSIICGTLIAQYVYKMKALSFKLLGDSSYFHVWERNNMICYFSGTGNSQLAAKQIAAASCDELFPINQSLKADAVETLCSEKPFVFVVPTYAWRIPRVVDQWIRKTTFTGSQDAYFVLTCGDSCGNAVAYVEPLCQQKGFRFRGLASVIMPENYLAMFPTPEKEEAQAILKCAKPQIAALAALIRESKPFPKTKVSLLGRLESGPVNPLFYRYSVGDRGFTVSSACTSCGLCAQRCPLNNITLEGEQPQWHGSCTHCMACIGGCPAEAIEYKNRSKGRPRYYIMEE